MMGATDKKNAGMEVAADFLKELGQISEGVVLLSLGLHDKMTDFLDLIER
jgi:hypothetical protein